MTTESPTSITINEPKFTLPAGLAIYNNSDNSDIDNRFIYNCGEVLKTTVDVYKTDKVTTPAFSQDLYSLNVRLEVLQKEKDRQYKYINKLENYIEANVLVSDKYIKKFQELVTRLETIFKQPGCCIVYDNGRIDSPDRLIDLSL